MMYDLHGGLAKQKIMRGVSRRFTAAQARAAHDICESWQQQIETAVAAVNNFPLKEGEQLYKIT
ncbi:MAG: hypothetical protein WBN75_19950 [Verrucomicrobiia bacterium]|jgi:hypothetical protein